MKLVCSLQVLSIFIIAGAEARRNLLSQCPHATSAKYTCSANAGDVAPFIVCLNLCPSSTPDPCAPCGNPAVTCSQVQAQRSGSRPVTFTATLRNYQYGDICFAAAPPVGQTTQESGTNGLPAVTNPGTGAPAPIYTGIAPVPAPAPAPSPYGR
ncbi:hypothetical protein WJX75_000502 [Coccomyxa subellipsoidea]|uniref:Pherophorin domain-containing protein n=1 Tax=Coccomyxa subellipsoidea TaxID=248742 RepID=A0ABR2YZC7_9CHLO